MNIKKEMIGISLLGLAGLLGGALLSLQLGDGKLMGPFGQMLALGLFALFGMGSYLVIIALFSISWGIFTSRFNLNDARLWFGYTAATLAGTVLMHLLFTDYRLKGLSAGGKTGEILGTMGISFFSQAGTFLITIVIMLLSLIMATQVSPVKAFMITSKSFLKIIKKLWEIVVTAGEFMVSLFQWEEVEDDYYVSNRTGDAELETDEDPLEPEKVEPDKEINVQKGTKPMNTQTFVKPKPANHPNNKEQDQKKEEITRKPEPRPKQSEAASATENLCANNELPEEETAEVLPVINKMEKRNTSEINSISKFDNENQDDGFILPLTEFLDYKDMNDNDLSSQEMLQLSKKMITTLKNYKIEGKVAEIHNGPVVTMYEFVPEVGTRVNKIEKLNKDLALSLAATRVRIVAPIPGKSAVGIEVPNKKRQIVYLKEEITDPEFSKSDSKLNMVLGKDIKGNTVTCDLAAAPHLLVAGATGSGKSVGINTMITSILYRATPDEVKFIMIDPKMVELSIYNDIPNLLLPVVTDPQKANMALQWAVREMERRYGLLSEFSVRDLNSYNEAIKEIKARGIECPETLPKIVIVIDEFADLMMVAAKEVETAVARIAQKARAVGIHLIVATQRPSTDVITGLIKSNFPSRISFMVSSGIDSKVILDQRGAETLLGNGDMLFSHKGLAPVRVHGSYVSTKEIQKVVEHLKEQDEPDYNLSIIKPPQEELPDITDEPLDPKWDAAISIIKRDQNASISYLQRRLSIGYNRAATIIERMEAEGIVSPPNNSHQREILISHY
ncbi:MAG: DNA translocase FtsK 4TM domain-containing protein [Deltaproteobacteria bacterium]|nr:DNA translocase FtsK 4TM domain-containing protein [Deltaproteobacteria bacterium]